MTGLYWLSSCFMLIVLTILFMRVWCYLKWESSKKYALAFVGSVQVYVLMDALFVQCFTSTERPSAVFRAVVFVFYLVYVIMPYIWHLFMQSYMGISCSRSVRILEAIPLCVLLGMLAVSVPTGIVWSIDAGGTYIRGSLFGVFALLNLTYYLMAFIQTCYFLCVKRAGEIRYQIKSSVFSAIPLVGILVNTYVIPLYGVYPFQPYCLLIGVLLTYLFMVEHQKDQLEAEYREMLSAALEQEKESARKAREAGQVKSVFLANMSHDIRTPMNAVLGFAEVIAQNPSDEAIVRESVEKIQMAGEMLMRIINDVLDLSRIESGKLHLEEKISDIRQIEKNLETMLEDSIQKNLCFETINQMQHPWVWCDDTKLQQILVNVMNNAIKFTPEGGNITLQCEECAVSEESSEYVITVRDTGIGMEEEFQKNAFEAFERERTSTESRTEGTGLGLAIVKKLVLLMKGEVSIRSKRGQGTEIELRLPFRHALPPVVSEEEEKETLSEDKLVGLRVLLVEDNELNADIARYLLTRAKMEIDRAKDGKACMRQLEEKPAGYYDLILMDIQMPEMDGYTAAKRIRCMLDPEKSGIPIIAMTANAFEEDRQAALAAGMDGFITKPIDTDKMIKEINRICRCRRSE